MKRYLILLLLLVPAWLRAQNASDLIISEVLVENDSSIVDDYGRRTGWIELMNTSQGTVNFGGCFLSDGHSRYMIPKGDLRTKLGPRQSVIFFCSGEKGEGTFYPDFTLSRGTTLLLISNNGKTLIDTIDIPEDLPAGLSVRKTARDKKGMDWQTDPQPAVPSPGAINSNGNERTGAEQMAEKDPHGWILTLTSISVVFGALILLWLIFSLLGKVFTRGDDVIPGPTGNLPPSGDPDAAVAAAIALALDSYLGDTVHDTESYRLTIRPAENPWASPGRNFRKRPQA